MNAVAWSPDGTRLATAADDRTVRIWDPATGQPAPPSRPHRPGRTRWPSPRRHPPGHRQSTTHGAAVGPATGRPPPTLDGHTDGLNAVAWSPDGTRLATASETARRGSGTRHRQPPPTLAGHTDGVTAVAWSPDGTRLGHRIRGLDRADLGRHPRPATGNSRAAPRWRRRNSLRRRQLRPQGRPRRHPLVGDEAVPVRPLASLTSLSPKYAAASPAKKSNSHPPVGGVERPQRFRYHPKPIAAPGCRSQAMSSLPAVRDLRAKRGRPGRLRIVSPRVGLPGATSGFGCRGQGSRWRLPLRVVPAVFPHSRQTILTG